MPFCQLCLEDSLRVYANLLYPLLTQPLAHVFLTLLMMFPSARSVLPLSLDVLALNRFSRFCSSLHGGGSCLGLHSCPPGLGGHLLPVLSEHSVPTLIRGHKHDAGIICLSVPSLRKGDCLTHSLLQHSPRCLVESRH